MKSMKGLSMNKMLGSIKKKAGGASLPPGPAAVLAPGTSAGGLPIHGPRDRLTSRREQ